MEQNQTPDRPRRRSPYQRNRALQGKYLTWLLVGAVVLFTVLGFLWQDREFSESENRKLAQFPTFSLSAVKDGSFLKGLGDYAADQFPGRDMWISLNLQMNKLLGQKEVSGVFLCEDDYLMQVPSEPNETQLQRNLEAINAFGETYSNLNIVMSVVPNAVTVHADKLPEYAPVRDQKADLEGIMAEVTGAKFVDVTGILRENRNQQLFYRTDHHWTSLGAYTAFRQIGPELGIEVPTAEQYTVYTVSNGFEGTLSSKSGSHSAYDKVEIYVPPTDIEYYVTYAGEQTGICSMYKREALNNKDHYTVFFGGNYSRVDITTTANTERNLLIFKDSYANCFVQFLYPYFDHITMIDPRYYYDNVANAIKSESITDVLYLYNLDTFLSDSSLADVLATGN